MASFARAPILCALMAFFAIAPLVCALVELEMPMTLYISQVASEPGKNEVIAACNNCRFGAVVVHDWDIRDQPDPTANVIGRAQGFHMHAGQADESWYSSMSLVFNDKRSSLLVAGILPDASEWSIVGGTGIYSMARGTVKYSTKEETSGKRLYILNVVVYLPQYETHPHYSTDSTAVHGKTGCNSKASEPIADN